MFKSQTQRSGTSSKDRPAINTQLPPSEDQMEQIAKQKEQAIAVQTEAHLRWLFLSSLAGDSEHYREFLQLMSMHLRAFYGRRMFHRSNEVEGLVQDALMAVHNRRGTYTANICLMAWVFAIAEHKLNDWLHCEASHETLCGPVNKNSQIFAATDVMPKASHRDLEKILGLLSKTEERDRYTYRTKGMVGA
jgi:hypothetical protein